MENDTIVNCLRSNFLSTVFRDSFEGSRWTIHGNPFSCLEFHAHRWNRIEVSQLLLPSLSLSLHQLLNLITNYLFPNSVTEFIVSSTGSCIKSKDEPECTGALKLLEENIVDVHTYPFPIGSIDPVISILDVITTGFETIQAIGTIFPSDLHTNGSKVVNSILGTVKVDLLTILLLISLFSLTWFGLVISLIVNNSKRNLELIAKDENSGKKIHMNRIRRHSFDGRNNRNNRDEERRSQSDRSEERRSQRASLDILMRLIEASLRQPNLNSNLFPGLIALSLLTQFLFLSMYFMIVYGNMFSTELIVEDPIPRIDTIDQLEKKNLSIIPEVSGLLQQLIKSQKEHSREVKLLKDRIPDCLMTDNAERCSQDDALDKEVIEQRAVMVQSLYYHKVTERFSCIKAGVMAEIDGKVNRYYVSKEKFLPMLLIYVGRKNLPIKIKRRLKFLFTMFQENGLELAHQAMIPPLSSRLAASSDEQPEIEACLRNKFLDTMSQRLEQSSVSLKLFIQIAILSIKILASALLCLVGEIIVRKWVAINTEKVAQWTLVIKN